jgi:hypothetical protein
MLESMGSLYAKKVVRRRFAVSWFHRAMGWRRGPAGDSAHQGSGFKRADRVRRVWGCGNSCCAPDLGVQGGLAEF